MSIPGGASLFPLFFAAVISLGAQTRYTGTVDQRLSIVDGSWVTFSFKSASDADLRSLPPSADRSGSSSAGRLPETNVRVVITDHPAGGAVVYADLNGDGKYSSNEQFSFRRLPGSSVFTADARDWPTQEACFDVPHRGQEFSAVSRVYKTLRLSEVDFHWFACAGLGHCPLGDWQRNRRFPQSPCEL